MVIIMYNKLTYLKNNDFSYIPLVGNTKIAAVSDWSKYSIVKSDFEPEQLLNNNVGIVTGPASNLLVLDIDDGILFTSFLKRYGFEVNKSYMVKTKRGYHLYFRYPADGKEYRCKQYQIWGFDIRGIGGYVVAPFSINEDGHEYVVVADGEIPEAPEWLLKFCFDVERSPVPNLDKISIPVDIKEIITNGMAIGQRSEAMMKVINALLLAKLTDDQLFYIFNTFPIGGKYIEKPSTIRDQWLQEQIDKCRETLVIPVERSSSKVPDISIVSGTELSNKDCKCVWLVDNLLEEGGHTLITGKSGVGKSLFTLNCALALASQQDFMGHKVNKPLNVAIIQCENSEPFMKHRLNKMVEAAPQYRSALERIGFIYFDGRHDNPSFRLSNSNLETTIEKIDNLKKIDVLVIDPYKSYAGTVENSNDENREVLDKLFAILNKRKITALIVHHEGRSNERYGIDRSRGASAVTDTISNYWSVYRKDDKDSDKTHFVVRCEKGRNYEKFDDIYLEIVNNFYFKYVSDPHDPRIIATIIDENGGAVETQAILLKLIMERLEIKVTKARQLLKDALLNEHILQEKYGQNKIKYSSILFKNAA